MASNLFCIESDSSICIFSDATQHIWETASFIKEKKRSLLTAGIAVVSYVPTFVNDNVKVDVVSYHTRTHGSSLDG